MGRQLPGDTILMSTETSCHFSHLLQVKNISLKSDFIHIFFMILYMYIAPGPTGADKSLGTKFWCQQEHPATSVICYKFQKNVFEVWFYTKTNNFIHYIAPVQGQTAPRGQSFDVNRNILTLHLFVESFKRISLKSDFIQILNDLIHAYSPRAGAGSPQGTQFWCQQKRLVTSFICCKFKKNVFEVWFYIICFIL